ncbi:MAG: STAS domain-containing protein [Ignavibacteria bacterium]|nr:STAS domain-containing protein [Ignavibacteria bacterium]
MNFTENKAQDIYIIGVKLSRTSIYMANEFKDFLNQAIDKKEKKILVDFSECDFIDSTFLGVLVIILKKVVAIGGSIRLVINNQNVKSSLEMTRMNKVFKVYDDLQTAISSFNE